MTRKHFTELARRLHESQPQQQVLKAGAVDGMRFAARYAQWEQDVLGIIDACHKFNDLFDEYKFWEVCQNGE